MPIIFWYFLILSHFTQYTHLSFSIPHFGVFSVFFHFLFLPDLVKSRKFKELQRFQTGEPLTCLVMAPGGLEAPDGAGVEHVAKDVHYKNIWNYQSWNPSWGLPKKQIIKLKHWHQCLSFGELFFPVPWDWGKFHGLWSHFGRFFFLGWTYKASGFSRLNFFHGLDCWMW